MAHRPPGKGRGFSWIFGLLTLAIIAITLFVIFAPLIENALLALLLKSSVAGICVPHIINGVNKTFHIDLANALKERATDMLQKPDELWSKLKRLWDKGPEETLTGPHDFAILYYTDQPGEAAKALIIAALEELCIHPSLQKLPWTTLGSFTRAWETASEAKHSIAVIPDQFLQRIPLDEQGEAIDLPALRTQVLTRVTRDTSRPRRRNASQGTLIFLDEGWEAAFLHQTSSSRDQLSAFSIDLSARTQAKEAIQALVPHTHCRVRPNPTNPPLPEATPAPPLLRVSNLPTARNPYLVQRSTPNSLRLTELFSDIDTINPIQVLWGPAGCGKTQLALEFARAYYQGADNDYPRRPYSLVLRLDLTTSLADGIDKLNSEIAGSHAAAPGFYTLQDLVRWLRNCPLDTNKHWLLIVDQCREQDFRKIYPHLNNIPRGHIIFTMNTRIDYWDSSVSLRSVDNMSPAEATTLLARVHLEDSGIAMPQPITGLSPADTRTYWQEAEELVRELGYNPLYIHHAGVTMRTQRRGPQAYKREYTKQLTRYLNDPRYTGLLSRNRALQNNLVIWKIAHKEIQKHPKAYQIFLLCAFLSTERIPGEIISQMPCIENERSFHDSEYRSDTSSESEALDKLHRQAILRTEPGPDLLNPLFRLENIVRNIVHLAKYGTIDPVDKEARKLYAIRCVQRAFASIPHKDSGQYPTYRPHIGECVGYLEEAQMQTYIARQASFIRKEAFQFLFTVGGHLQAYPEQESEYRTDARAEESKTIELRAWHLFHLAMRLHTEWNLQSTDSLELLVQQLSLVGRFSHEHFLYRNKGRLHEAESYYLAAVRHASHLPADHSPTDPDLVLSIHHNLGRLYTDLGKYGEAETQFAMVQTDVGRLLAHRPHDATLSLRQAETCYSQANNAVTQGYRCQDHGKAAEFYTQAEASYKEALESLQKLGEKADLARDLTQRAQRARRSCQVSKLALTLHRHAEEDVSLLRAEVEASRICLDQAMAEFQEMNNELPGRQTEEKVLEYGQLLTDLNTLAQAYRILAQQTWRGRRAYRQQSKEYTFKALNYFQSFLKHHPQAQEQKAIIAMMRHIWGNFEQNPLYNAGETKTRYLREHQSQVLGLAPVPHHVF